MSNNCTETEQSLLQTWAMLSAESRINTHFFKNPFLYLNYRHLERVIRSQFRNLFWHFKFQALRLQILKTQGISRPPKGVKQIPRRFAPNRTSCRFLLHPLTPCYTQGEQFNVNQDGGNYGFGFRFNFEFIQKEAVGVPPYSAGARLQRLFGLSTLRARQRVPRSGRLWARRLSEAKGKR
jgi:hypothetical protein